jgi:small ligand-binding sensory domain FIST
MTDDTRTSSAAPAAASAISGHFDTRTACMEVADILHDSLAGGCDLLLMFASFHHVAAFSDAAESLRSTLEPTVMLGVTAEAVLGGEEEREGVAGFSALALRLPGATLHAFTFTESDPLPIRQSDAMAARIGAGPGHCVTLMLVDPFSVPLRRILPAMSACGGATPVRIAGGVASGASQPGYNRILCNDHIAPHGGVGVTISNLTERHDDANHAGPDAPGRSGSAPASHVGPDALGRSGSGGIDVDCIVSQGCRPIGKPLVITKAEEHVILELGGRPAFDVLRETAEHLPSEEKQLLSKGLLLGAVINEYKDHFGRGDFLVRGILGFDEKRKAIQAGDISTVGQTVQFHVRDAQTAGEDLALLLDAQQLDQPPFGALCFTCNGRGRRLFEEPNHDLGMIHQRLGNVPTAGFFCAGEIGPIGDRCFIHGHTASLVLFRERARTD